MKRYILLITAALLVLSLMACDGTVTGSTGTSRETASPTGETAPATEAELKEYTTDDVKAAIARLSPADLSFGEIINMADESDEVYSAPEARPIASHPRVLFNSDTLETVKANMNVGENAIFYKAYADLRDTLLPLDGRDFDDVNVIQAKAFAYIAEGNEKCGYEAVYAVLNELIHYEEEDPRYYDSYERNGNVFYTAGIVYDWCYDLLTAEQKTAIVAAVTNKVGRHSAMEIGYPPDGQAPIASHGSEEQLLKHWLSFSIAVYDEYPEIYDFVGGRFFDQYVPARNYFYTNAGFVSQGTAYIATRYNNDMYSRVISIAGLGIDPYDPSMVEVCRSLSFYIRPDWEMLRQGDDFNQKHGPYEIDDVTWTLWFSGNIFKDGTVKSVAKYYSNDYTRWIINGGTAFTPVEALIVSDPSVELQDISTLGLTRYIGTPFSRMIARTGWDLDDAPNGDWSSGLTSDTIMAHMNIGERYSLNHEWLCAGSFALYYKGALAIDAGAYGEYREGTHLAYSIQAVAHNCLLIKGPENPTGNQQLLDESQSFTLRMWQKFTNYKTGETLAHESKETGDHVDYAYISGDVAAAYRKNAKKFASEAVRSMLFIQAEDGDPFAGLFFVFDNVTPKEGYDTTFLLHMEEEPAIDGNITTITATREGANGKLVNQTLLPLNHVITVIGGEGHECEVDGVNYYPDQSNREPGSDLELGWGRVEITNADDDETDYFLNAMYLTEADNDAPLTPAELFETDAYAAAKLGRYAAVFMKSSKRTGDGFDVTVDGDGELIYFVAGTQAGEWTVTVGGDTLTAVASDDGGCLYFTAPAGTLHFEMTGAIRD